MTIDLLCMMLAIALMATTLPHPHTPSRPISPAATGLLIAIVMMNFGLWMAHEPSHMGGRFGWGWMVLAVSGLISLPLGFLTAPRPALQRAAAISAVLLSSISATIANG